MNSNKSDVDGSFISTDVDNLIRTIAEKKKVALKDLQKICQIDKKNLEKWVTVLEEEGYVVIEYGLGRTYVLWKGLDEHPPEENIPQEMSVPEDIEDIDIEQENLTDESESSEETEEKEKFPVEMPLEEPREARTMDPHQNSQGSLHEQEELLGEDVKQKNETAPSESTDLKFSILTKLEGNDPNTNKSDDKLVGEPDEPPVIDPPHMPDDSDEIRHPFIREPGSDSVVEDVVFEKEVLRPQTKKESETSAIESNSRTLMNAYLQEIKKEKIKIDGLRAQREDLYREKFSTLEGRMHADLVAFTEKILEKQSSLTQIKESVLELPDKVEEVDRIQQQMSELKAEGRDALVRTREKAESYITDMEQSKEKMKGRIDELTSLLEQQSSKIQEIEELSSSLDERSNTLKEEIGSARSSVEDLNSAIQSLGTDVQEVDEARSKLFTMRNEIKEKVTEHSSELESLTTELEDISSVERWVAEYVRDYESKMEEIDDYVSSSENALSDLKESAESLYMKKYLGELEGMASEYEDQLEDAVAADKSIEEKIASSRSRIAELARESQKMMKELNLDVSQAKDYNLLLNKTREKTAKVKKIVEGKKAERSHIDQKEETIPKEDEIPPKSEKRGSSKKPKVKSKKRKEKSAAKD